jgi:hypothetical protein
MDVAGMLKAYNYEVRKNIRNILCKPIKAILPMFLAKVTETITSFTKRFDDAILTGISSAPDMIPGEKYHVPNW